MLGIGGSKFRGNARLSVQHKGHISPVPVAGHEFRRNFVGGSGNVFVGDHQPGFVDHKPRATLSRACSVTSAMNRPHDNGCSKAAPTCKSGTGVPGLGQSAIPGRGIAGGAEGHKTSPIGHVQLLTASSPSRGVRRPTARTVPSPPGNGAPATLSEREWAPPPGRHFPRRCAAARGGGPVRGPAPPPGPLLSSTC